MGEVARAEHVPPGAAPEALSVTLRLRVSRHFPRRLAERGGDAERLVVEGGTFEAAGRLRPVREHDFGLIVPGLRPYPRPGGPGGARFVAVTYLPTGAS